MRQFATVLAVLACAFSSALAFAAQSQDFQALAALQMEAGIPGNSVDIGRFRQALAGAGQPPETIYVQARAVGQPAATIPLPQILNNIRRTASVFTVNGAAVRVFGMKSLQNSWFVGLWPDADPTPIFERGAKLIHHWPLSRTLYPKIDGRSCTMYLQAAIFHQMQSQLVIIPEGQPQARFSIPELANNAYWTGYPARIGNQDYRIIYSQDFKQDPDGDFGGYTGERSIAFLYRDGNDIKGFQFFESKIPRGRQAQVLIEAPKVEKSDDNNDEGSLTMALGLRLDDAGNLQIYYPVP